MTATTIVLLLLLSSVAYAKGPSRSARTTTVIVATWQCQDHTRQQRTRASSAKATGAAYQQWILNLWTNRLASCRAKLKEIKRQWNWQAFLPAKWYRLGSCETGYGRDPNWFHANSRYVSAFGIQRGSYPGAYDHDAARVGMPPWNDTSPPTPWQQYKTALSHHDNYGGFSGWGCRNA